MKVLVTGARGFVGKNLVAALRTDRSTEVLEYDLGMNPALLDSYCKTCEFVYHLAGVNRPNDPQEFMEGNADFTSVLLDTLQRHQNKAPVMLASSIQADLDNPYGKSKRAGEERLQSYGRQSGVMIYIYRFSNLYGKWCRPNYNSVVATFCHNIARNLPIQIHDPDVKLSLVYIDDVVVELLRLLHEGGDVMSTDGYYYISQASEVTLGELAGLIHKFKASRSSLEIPDMTDGGFIKKLYSTYLSYLPEDDFSYPLKMNIDERGSFTEVLRTLDRGQLSVNISKPGVEKGNHWHHTKNEKFIVVSGEALIQLRKLGTEEIISYRVSGNQLEVVDIPVGYTHNITNVSDTTDLVTLMWCNECYDPENPDTYFEHVKNDTVKYPIRSDESWKSLN